MFPVGSETSFFFLLIFRFEVDIIHSEFAEGMSMHIGINMHSLNNRPLQ